MGIDTSHISLEPLLNKSTTGSGTSLRLAVVPVNEVAVGSHRTAIALAGVAQAITPSTGVRTIHIQNTGDNNAYYGGATVDSTDGVILYPSQTLTFSNIQDTFSLYFVATVAATTTLRVGEFT